jgi:hypothetical protein
MTKPIVTRLDGFGGHNWWCIIPSDAKGFDTWPEALDYANSLVVEPTA